MSSVRLKFIETYFTDSEKSAEQLVSELKNSLEYVITAHTITKKVKKESEYYIVKATKEYNQEKDLV